MLVKAADAEGQGLGRVERSAGITCMLVAALTPQHVLCLAADLISQQSTAGNSRILLV
jgi:hypothetical protein